MRGKKRNNTKPQRKPKCDKREQSVRDEFDGSSKSQTNDVAWYSTTPELLKDAASVPFSYPAGVQLTLGVNTQLGTINGEAQPYATPGILAMSIVPAIGDDGSLASPVNVAATAMYSFVRHANSGSANYNAPDLMIYAMSMAQIYSYLNFLIRVYGTVNLYSHQNRYIPRALCNAQGVDFDSIYQNLANFRYGVNALIHKAASLACPADMTYFKRIAFLFSGVYSEGDTPKDQLYIMYPLGFMKYQEVASTQGGSLTFAKLNDHVDTSYLSYSQLLTYGNSLLNPILQSEDMNIMSGDILKAYGSNGILKLGTLSEDYIVIPTTDLTVLEQIQNANYLGGRLPFEYSVTQNMTNNALECTIGCNIPAGYESNAVAHEMIVSRRPLTTILVNPEAGDVMERTRLMHTFDAFTEGSTNMCRAYCTSEIAVDVNYWSTVTYNGVTTLPKFGEPTPVNYMQEVIMLNSTQISDYTMTTIQAMYNTIWSHCVMENFKFHPIVAYFILKPAMTDLALMSAAIDLDNYTMIDSDTLSRINEAAALALFNVPSIAKF